MNIKEFETKHPEIFFNVKEGAITVDGIEAPHYKGLINESTNKIISIVSNVYAPADNKKVIGEFCRIADEAGIGYSFIDAAVRRYGKINTITIDFPDYKIVTGKNGTDISWLRGSLKNSFDTSSNAILDMGFWRQVCSNGAGIYEKDTTFSYRHSGEIEKKIIANFKGHMEETLGIAQKFVDNLTELSFPDKESVKTAIESAEFLSKKSRELVEDQWKTTGEESLNGWNLFNAFTQVVTHQMKGNKVKANKKVANMAHDWLSLPLEVKA